MVGVKTQTHGERRRQVRHKQPRPAWRLADGGSGGLPAPACATAAPLPTVCILLSVYNGAAFLEALLASLLEQRGVEWVLYWRDDGSHDGSTAIMHRFQAQAGGAGRCVAVPAPEGGNHLGVMRSYAWLLAHAPQNMPVAFCDQDDVWFPDKLHRALVALACQPEGAPALYCSRQVLTDSALRPLGLSPRLPPSPCFLMALTQNIATGCTVVLSAQAVRLVCQCPPPAAILHDWWAYLVVSGAGGRILVDNQPTLFYRQHGGNTVGASARLVVRAAGALRRGPRQFMDIFYANISALLLHPALSAQNRAGLHGLRGVLDDAGPARWRRARTLWRLRAMRRSALPDQCVFGLWFLLA